MVQLCCCKNRFKPHLKNRMTFYRDLQRFCDAINGYVMLTGKTCKINVSPVHWCLVYQREINQKTLSCVNRFVSLLIKNKYIVIGYRK